MNSDAYRISEITRDEKTDFIYDELCYGDPVENNTPEEVINGINKAIELNERPMFREGLAARLNELGESCTADNTNIMLTEVKKRYKSELGKSCPRTVQEWIKGTPPSIVSPVNNYDLCFALGMDLKQTASFFIKHFLTIPFNCKSRTDAVFMYCMHRKRPYSVITKMLECAEKYPDQEAAHTVSSQIRAAIADIDDDDEFVRYLSKHCYSNEQQFQLARETINKYIEKVKKNIIKYGGSGSFDIQSPDRINSLIVAELLGERYQSKDENKRPDDLPKLPERFTKSLPNDVTLGKIIRGENASYETLRKTLMLLNFYDVYCDPRDMSRDEVVQVLLDFYDGLNAILVPCGFAPIYECHPFDCLLLYCANSYDPLETLHYIYTGNPD